jgi:hypothetical protein
VDELSRKEDEKPVWQDSSSFSAKNVTLSLSALDATTLVNKEKISGRYSILAEQNGK